MVKEPKNIDFYTTGKEPSLLDFERISEWIRKKRQSASQPKKPAPHKKLRSKQNISRKKTAN